ncbi:MAG: alpha/beta hydrolase [Gemmataceae bacterium]
MKHALLVHGLGRMPFSMTPLAGPLQKLGYRPRYFMYSATIERLPDIVSRLVRKLKTVKPQVVIGHSLGGVLLRFALAQCPELEIEHFFMLGTPNQSPRVARYFWNWWAFRMFSQSCGAFLASPDAYRTLPVPTVPYTVFAGSYGLPVWMDPFKGEPNDRIVAVSETVIEDNHPPVLVPAEHSLITYSRTVRSLIVEQLSKSCECSSS